jgi:microcompartment protein CcmL/EutN
VDLIVACELLPRAHDVVRVCQTTKRHVSDNIQGRSFAQLSPKITQSESQNRVTNMYVRVLCPRDKVWSTSTSKIRECVLF